MSMHNLLTQNEMDIRAIRAFLTLIFDRNLKAFLTLIFD